MKRTSMGSDLDYLTSNRTRIEKLTVCQSQVQDGSHKWVQGNKSSPHNKVIIEERPPIIWMSILVRIVTRKSKVHVLVLVLVHVVCHHNTNDDANNNENYQDNEEAYPSFFTSSPSGCYGLLRVSQTARIENVVFHEYRRAAHTPFPCLSEQYQLGPLSQLLFHLVARQEHSSAEFGHLPNAEMNLKTQTSLNNCASSPRVLSMRLISSCRSWTSRYAARDSPYRFEFMS